MADLFLFGTLLDGDLRRIVAGCDLVGVPAVLPGHSVWRAADGDHPVLGPVRETGQGAAGLLLRDVPEAAMARLDFYEAGFGYGRGGVNVRAGGAICPALVYLPATPGAPGRAPWSLADWQAGWGAMNRAAAREAMALLASDDGAGLKVRMPTIRMRADSSLRAGAAKPARPWQTGATDRASVGVIATRRPYTAFFAVDEIDLTHTRFDGTTSGAMTRAGFLMGDAVTVLPYDPVRDRVLLVEQFRFGMYLRGDPAPWSLEPVAGRIDPGETPEVAARREAREEAGLVLDRLLPLGGHYPSPAAVSEYLFSFVAPCDLPDLAMGTGGLETEHEDIRTHVLPFERVLDWADSGALENTPLLFTLNWLARRRGRPGAFA